MTLRTWGLFWSLLETVILTLFTFAGGFINGVLSGLGATCTPGCTLTFPSYSWGNGASLAGLFLILVVAFLMGYSIVDWYTSLKAFLIAQTISFTVYILTFSLIPSSLSKASTSPMGSSLPGALPLILTYLVGLGIIILLAGGVLTIIGSVMAEKYSQPPLRPL